MHATRSRMILGGLMPLLLLLAGCGWEPVVPPPTSDAEPPAQQRAPEITADIRYDCVNCVQSKGSTPATTYTFEAQVELPDTERVTAYNWQFDDGTEKSGQQVTHTFEQSGDHKVTLQVTTASGATAQAATNVAVEEPTEPEPEQPATRHDVAEGELCTLERIMPRTIDVGESFQVEVRIKAHRDVRYVIWEDTTWFPQFRVQQDPTGLWIDGMEAGSERRLFYDVELWKRPTKTDLWMEGFVKCNTGGSGPSERTTLRTPIQVNLDKATAPSQTPSSEIPAP